MVKTADLVADLRVCLRGECSACGHECGNADCLDRIMEDAADRLDESAACVPPKVYGAISTAVLVMDAVGKTIDAAQCVMADSLQAVCAEAQDGR